ncbi:MAG: hypothetical protein WCP16_05975 [Pseudanabaena sp. ELA645]|jgi:hypothetical protein
MAKTYYGELKYLKIAAITIIAITTKVTVAYLIAIAKTLLHTG